MKGLFNIYPLFTEIASRSVRRSVDKKLTTLQCLHLLFKEVPDMVRSINCTILAEEYYWLNHSSVVIFPETSDILERLSQAKFSISKSSGIQFPHDCFLLAFPKGFKINDIQTNGCMITYMRRVERYEKIHKPFFKYLNLGQPQYQENEHSKGFYFTYMNPFEKNILIRGCIPMGLIAKCLKAKTFYEYGALVGNFEKHLGDEFIPLNDAELEYQFELFQIIARVGVYSTSCDNALRSGYPHVRPKHLEPKGLSYTDVTLSAVSEPRASSMYYRSWHFRQLNHEKYYQGEHSNKPIGSRIVFVKDTMVNQNIEAETLT